MLNNLGITGTPVLPVTWQGFVAEANGLSAKLEWQVSEEFNCDRYEVLRSVDGDAWEQVGMVPGRNPEGGKTSYRFIDTKAGRMQQEELYYQIRQIDYDGQQVLSDRRSVKFGNLAEWIVSPNPVTGGSFTVDLPADLIEGSSLILTDLQGREQWNLSAKAASISFSTEDLTSGVYFLTWKTAQARQTRRLMVY